MSENTSNVTQADYAFLCDIQEKIGEVVEDEEKAIEAGHRVAGLISDRGLWPTGEGNSPASGAAESYVYAIEVLEDALLTTYTVDVCRHTGDPGCYAALHDGPHEWEEVQMRRCLCGADESMGHGLIHDDECPLHEENRKAYI